MEPTSRSCSPVYSGDVNHIITRSSKYIEGGIEIDKKTRDIDEDSDGNLKDFIVPDDYVSYEDSAEEDDNKTAKKKQKRDHYDIPDKTKFKRLHKKAKSFKPILDKRLLVEHPKRKLATPFESKLYYNLCVNPETSVGKDVIGRHAESMQVISMVQGPKGCLRPLLIGPEGIGKRSIVEKVAYLLRTNLNHPLWSYDKICCINAGQLQKTSDYSGRAFSIAEQFQQFVNDTFKRTNPKILYVHDIDKIINVEDETLAIQGILESPFPFIASISGDSKEPDVAKAITRLQKYKFEPIIVQESSIQDVEIIVKDHLKKNPIFPNLRITEETITAGVKLSAKYLRSRPLPVKAINLIQECANAVLIDHINKNKVNDDIRVTPFEIAKLMEVKTKVSWEDLLNASAFSEKRFVTNLKGNLVGQDYAIETVSSTVASYKMGLTDPSKPWGVFLFVGPTGVGKTELAKLLAKYLYQSDEAFVRIDGTEFQESHTISRLIGAPPGYEGHETGGQLTEALRRNSHLVILFDEFEKAHNEVRRLFLQVFDNGRLTDGRGKTVDCTQALFIMTSNLGSKELFQVSAKKDMTPQSVLKAIDSILIDNLSPELCNRFTAIIPFQPLKKVHIPGVVGVQLKRISERLRTQADIELTWTQELVNHFANFDGDIRLGMRNLCRLIDKSIVEALKEVFSKQKQAFKGKVNISARDDSLLIRLKRS